jgi:hypothetical protein
MAEMGKYCKAYLLKDLRRFSGWTEKSENAHRGKKEEGQEVEAIKEFTDDTLVYVQENYVITDGIFKDENILFEDITPEWIEYCQQSLKFEIPEYEPITPMEEA